MSAIVRTQTPFLYQDVLLRALKRIGEPCGVASNGNIWTNRRDYYGTQVFELRGSRYVLRHDSSANSDRYGSVYPWGNLQDSPWMLVRDFLVEVQKAYNAILAEDDEKLRYLEQEHLKQEEAERLQREAEEREAARLAYIQAQEKAIMERAKADGYYVTRKEVAGKIRLTLSRTR